MSYKNPIPLSDPEIGHLLEALLSGEESCFSVPNNAYERPLAFADMAQLQITLANRLKKFQVQAAGTSLEQSLNTFASTPAGLLSLHLADSINTVDVGEISEKSRLDTLKRALATYERFPDFGTSREVFLLCSDTNPRWSLPQFYLPGSDFTLKGPDYFAKTLFPGILKAVGNKLTLNEEVNKTGAVGAIIWELFKNTHDHARLLVSGQRPRKSVRALYAALHDTQPLTRTSDQESDSTTESPDVAYFKWLGKSTASKSVLEITIVDSGPGLAARRLGRPLSQSDSIDIEGDAVVECMKKGASSLSTTSRGFGLFVVLRNLKDLQGFFRIRTGRTHLYRDFGPMADWLKERQPSLASVRVGQTDKKPSEYRGMVQQATAEARTGMPMEALFDWRNRFSTRPSAGPSMHGTVVSILIPL